MFSDPVVGEEFFGRRDLIELLAKRATALKNGYRQNVAIIGHRELGKTSALRQFLHSFRDPDLTMIYVEIKFQSLDLFVDQFIRSLLFEVVSRVAPADPLGSMEGLIASAEAVTPRTAERCREIKALLKSRKFEEAYTKLFELTSVLKSETGRCSVVVLDEFHRLGEFGVKNAFSDFGKRIMIQKDTMYVLASSSFTASRKILAEKLALLFGNFERIYLEPFDFNTSFEFIEKKVAPVAVPKESLAFLVSFTDGHPFFLDTVTRQLRELALARGEAVLTRSTIAESLCRLLFESQGVLNQYMMKLISPWSGPSAKGAHLMILTELASDTNKLKELSRAVNRSQREVSREISDLMEHELIVKTGVFFRFHNRVFKFWLREVYRRRELSLLGLDAKNRDFCARVEELMNEFDELQRMDITERVNRLFSHFRNDRIELGDKTRVLPHFTELTGETRSLVARSNGRCWICKITEDQATEEEVLRLVSGVSDPRSGTLTRVLVALGGMDDNAKLLAKEKKVLTLGLSKVNLLMDIYGKPPLVFPPRPSQ